MRVIWLFITIFTFNDSIEFYVPIAQNRRGNKIKIQTTTTTRTAGNKAKQSETRRTSGAATHQIMTVVGIICKESSTQVGDPPLACTHSRVYTSTSSLQRSALQYARGQSEAVWETFVKKLSRAGVASCQAALHKNDAVSFGQSKKFSCWWAARWTRACVCVVCVFGRVSTAKKREERGKSTIFAGTAWTDLTKRIKVCYAKRFAQMKNENLFAKYCRLLIYPVGAGPKG